MSGKMFCKICGAHANEQAAFCGHCGAALRERQQRFRVYSYSEAEARANGAYASYAGVIVFSLIATMVLIGVILAAALSLPSPAMEIVCGLCGVAFFVGIVAYAFNRRIYVMGKQYAYIWDSEQRVLYSLCLMGPQMYGWNTMTYLAAAAGNIYGAAEQSKRAQQESLCIQYIQQFIDNGKPSQKFWTLDTPTEVIIELKDARVIKSSRKLLTVQYTNQKGKVKKVKIIKAFPGIEECFEH